MTRRLLILPLVAMLFAFFAPSAWADPPTPTDVVAQLNSGQRVYVDPDAAPKLPNPQAINDQILQTGLPMIVVNVAASQTAPTDASPRQSTEPFYAALHATHNPLTKDIQVDGKPHKPPLIILVFDSKNYHAFSYDVSASIAAATGPDMIQAAAGHHGDINGAVSAFISLLAGTQVTGPVLDNPDAVTPPPAQPTNYAQPRNYALAWAFLWVSVGFVVLVIIFALSYTIAEGRRAKAEDRELVQDRINRARKDVDRLAHEVLKGKDVSAEQNSAAMSVGTAEEAFERGDMASARSHVGIADAEIAAAYAVINPGRHIPRRAHVFALDDVPKAQRRRTKITATCPQGKRVVISNTNYKTRFASGYRNYYPGGMCGGVPFPAGWYPYLFWTGGWTWTPADVLATNSPLPTHSPADYGYRSGGASVSINDAGDSGRSSGGSSAPLVSTPEPGYHHHFSSPTDYGSWSGGASAPIYTPDPTSSIGFGGAGGFGGDSSGGGNAGL
jgi:hypothetical protein